MYDSVCSVLLVARYAQWFTMENHGNFGAPYLEF